MKTFEELGVLPEICKAIQEMGYETPMPVQEEVIPFLLEGGNDIVALAQTGTGKTAAFGLPLIQKVNVQKCVPQALILCPTRELCLQIAGDLTDYSKYIQNLKGYYIESVETFNKAGRGVQAFRVYVKDGSGNSFFFHVDPWGRVGGPISYTRTK